MMKLSFNSQEYLRPVFFLRRKLSLDKSGVYFHKKYKGRGDFVKLLRLFSGQIVVVKSLSKE